MAINKFTVFGVDKQVYETDQAERTSLFTAGLQSNTVAKSDDVNTGLRETTLVTVSILDWIKGDTVGDFITPETGQVAVDAFKTKVTSSLTARINALITVKENTINATNNLSGKYYDGTDTLSIAMGKKEATLNTTNVLSGKYYNSTQTLATYLTQEYAKKENTLNTTNVLSGKYYNSTQTLATFLGTKENTINATNNLSGK